MFYRSVGADMGDRYFFLTPIGITPREDYSTGGVGVGVRTDSPAKTVC